MCRESQTTCLIQKIGSLLSTFLVILMLVLSPVTVPEAHDAPHQTMVIAVAAHSQVPANCHSYASCSVFVVPSDVELVTAAALHRLQFLSPEPLFLAANIPLFDTPPPRV